MGEDPAPIGETLALREEERREGRLLDVTHVDEGQIAMSRAWTGGGDG
jgi:hypothetical protein